MNDQDDAQADTRAARVWQQVEDALELANYVVETGVKDSDGQPIAFADIAAIQAMAGKIGILDVGSADTAAGRPSPSDWLAFEQAYYRLAIATHPVTAETLRNTTSMSDWDENRDRLTRTREILFGDSAAQRFTRGLLYVTICFALFVVVAEWQINVLGMETASKVQTRKDLWQSLLPWSYGGLGACAYLLRSAHTFIYQRCFDVRRKPEYTNRILLGSISGGAIILFANYLASEDDTATHFGSAALGFIAGYSTDFLFNTIERIVTAIFPKVQVETVADSSSTWRGPKLPLKKPDPPGPGVAASKQTKQQTP